jgi:hypothetical protein
MKTLFVLLAVMLSLGSYFSDGKPARDPEVDAARAVCVDPACRNHAPYLGPRVSGRNWPDPPHHGPDPNCGLRQFRRP